MAQKGFLETNTLAYFAHL